MDVRFKGRAGLSMGGTILTFHAMDEAGVNAGFHPAVIPAIVAVECDGEGFLPDGRLKMLFEATWFSRLTRGDFDSSHPQISAPAWDRSLYWGGAAEYRRLEVAMALNSAAALKSASWGMFQILGVNHREGGWDTVQEMVSAMADDPAAHLSTLLRFLSARHLDVHARAMRWDLFAHGYNGPGYAKHRYHLRLAVAVAACAGLPGLRIGEAGERVRSLQCDLAAAGAQIECDGALGPATAAALLAFQAETLTPYPGAK